MTDSLDPDPAIIRIRDLVFRRGARTILDGVSLDIPRGAIVAFMGPSGVGKTTVLRLISGQLRPDSGSIMVNGREVAKMRSQELYEFRKDLGFLLQNGALFTDLTVFENIATPLREHSALDEAAIEAQQRAEAWLAAVYEQYDIDVLMYGAFYTTGGAAGVPAINIPIGSKIDLETGEPTGEPAGVAITGPYLSDAQLIAVGYALEQALGGYVAPDLDATIAEIEEVTGQ
jgi:hypothetical protein